MSLDVVSSHGKIMYEYGKESVSPQNSLQFSLVSTFPGMHALNFIYHPGKLHRNGSNFTLSSTFQTTIPVQHLRWDFPPSFLLKRGCHLLKTTREKLSMVNIVYA